MSESVSDESIRGNIFRNQGTPYRFIFYDGLHFAAVCRHIVQEELHFSIHIGYTKVAICSVGIKNIVHNFVLCSKNIMFTLHNKLGI